MCVCVKSIGYFQEVVALLSLLSFLFNQIRESETRTTGHCFLRNTHKHTLISPLTHLQVVTVVPQIGNPFSAHTYWQLITHQFRGSVSGSVCVSTSGLLPFACLFSLQMLSVAFIEGKEGSVSLTGERPELYRRSYSSRLGHQKKLPSC